MRLPKGKVSSCRPIAHIYFESKVTQEWFILHYRNETIAKQTQEEDFLFPIQVLYIMDIMYVICGFMLAACQMNVTAMGTVHVSV